MRSRRETTILEDTIFEEEEEEEEDEGEEEEKEAILELSCKPSYASADSISMSTIMPTLQGRAKEWSRVTGAATDSIICVGDQKFHLHKEPLTSRSGFLKRHLAGKVTGAVATVPAPVTAAAFALVAHFCYVGDLTFAPSNIASLRIAAEWLEMTEDDGGGSGDENLLERVERYFYHYVAKSPKDAATVLRSCVGLLGRDQETAAGLAGRCVEALAEAEDGGRGPWLDVVAELSPEVLRLIVRAMRPRFAESHDRLYQIVDNYLKRHKTEPTEEEKTRLCYTIDCRKLSGNRLVHLVRNPRMPLRFIVQAILGGEHLLRARKHTSSHPFSASLGAILHHDAVQRQTSHLRATMEMTNQRIRCLESDVTELKRRLKEMKGEMEEEEEEEERAPRSFSAEEGRWKLGRRLVEKLTSMFRGQWSSSSSRSTESKGEELRRKVHGRSRSFA